MALSYRHIKYSRCAVPTHKEPLNYVTIKASIMQGYIMLYVKYRSRYSISSDLKVRRCGFKSVTDRLYIYIYIYIYSRYRADTWDVKWIKINWCLNPTFNTGARWMSRDHEILSPQRSLVAITLCRRCIGHITRTALTSRVTGTITACIVDAR